MAQTERIVLPISAELLGRIDEACGDVPRVRWIRTAIEQRLGVKPTVIPRETVAAAVAPKKVAPVTDCEHKYRSPDGRCLRPGCGDRR